MTYYSGVLKSATRQTNLNNNRQGGFSESLEEPGRIRRGIFIMSELSFSLIVY